MLFAQFAQFFAALFKAQWCGAFLGQGGHRWCCQFLAVEHARTDALVVFLEHGVGAALGVGCQKIPVGGAASVVNGIVAPIEFGLGGTGAAGFQVGAVGVGQAEGVEVRFAQFANGVKRGQVGRLANTAAPAPNDFVRAEVNQIVQPKLLGNLGFVAGKSLVKLVVVGQFQFGKKLVDSVDMLLGDGWFRWLICR